MYTRNNFSCKPKRQTDTDVEAKVQLALMLPNIVKNDEQEQADDLQ
jgi:hypothetical protein